LPEGRFTRGIHLWTLRLSPSSPWFMIELIRPDPENSYIKFEMTPRQYFYSTLQARRKTTRSVATLYNDLAQPVIPSRFNPFSLPLAEFPPDELNRLREVDEGWYVDYKSEPVSVAAFGKYLSSFANQYGGWLFIGVKEGPNKSLRAGSFPGIPKNDVPKTLVQIREGVTAHVSPFVYFEHRVIEGPVDVIGLETNKAIVIVYVPEGTNPPFVHSTGKIYRRKADASEPEEETDRAVLDSLWRKSESVRIRLEEFILSPARTLVQGNPFCCIYLLSDPTFSGPEHSLSFSQFKDAMREIHDPGMAFDLDNIFPTQDGYSARCLSLNEPGLDLTGLRWWHNGNVRLTIPLNLLESSFNGVYEGLHKEFIEIMDRKFLQQRRRTLDLDEWLMVVLGLTGRYLDLRDSLKLKGPIWAKALFAKVRGDVPFIGMPSYLTAVRDYGLPVIPDELVLAPIGTSMGDLVRLDDPEALEFTGRIGLVSLPLIARCVRSLGVVFAADEKMALQEFIAAFSAGCERSAQRSAEEMKNRQRRTGNR
jgi:hypothetical protein